MTLVNKGKILVIDDDPTSLHLIADILEPQGYDLAFGTRGEDAIDRCEKDVDLILLDYHLPDANGIDICQKLKQHPDFGDIPVIFITANQDHELEADGFAAGAVDFITKPYSASVMVARVRTHVALKRQTDLLLKMTRVDDLTGVFNRRHVFEVGSREFSRAKRIGADMCAMVLDIDFFKKINDTYGHDVGDKALIVFAQSINQRVRATDIFGRVGGEEFIILLPDTNVKEALLFGEILLNLVRSIEVSLDNGGVLRYTVSIGLSNIQAIDSDLNEMIKRADENLYHAKQGGRDQIFC
ncbi:MAG TPA: diguanylate cyclase [Pseudomonadales bacterium]|nr:diguanylate cyclase [Pseudomonadales bacterium]